MISFSGGSGYKESTCNVGDVGSIPGLGRSPGGGHGNPLQCSCLENPMDRRACYCPWSHKESDTTKELSIAPIAYGHLVYEEESLSQHRSRGEKEQQAMQPGGSCRILGGKCWECELSHWQGRWGEKGEKTSEEELTLAGSFGWRWRKMRVENDSGFLVGQ